MGTTCVYCDGTGTTPQPDDPNECGFCTGGRAAHDQIAAVMTGVCTVVERLTEAAPHFPEPDNRKGK